MRRKRSRPLSLGYKKGVNMPKTKPRQASKIRPVPLGQIVIPPAYLTQRPFIPSWGAELAANLDLNKLGYPIINHRENKFLCVDGQHRIYGLRQNDFSDGDLVDCEVYENLSDEEMADLFLGRDDRTAIGTFVKFHIACTAGYQRENAIRRVVEANG